MNDPKHDQWDGIYTFKYNICAARSQEKCYVRRWKYGVSLFLFYMYKFSNNWLCNSNIFCVYSGLLNSCRPTFIYKSDFFWKCRWKENQKITAMPRLM
jgi:hypothetical protein